MTIEQFSAIGEIIASVAVVASLIYVARQLRQTNTMMRVAAASERLEKDYQLVLPMIESREVAEIWVKGANDFAELDPVDQQRLLFFERRALMLWHHFFHLRRQDLVSDHMWNEQVWIMRNIGRRQALRETWKIFRDNFDKPFVEFVEGQFALAEAEDRGEK